MSARVVTSGFLLVLMAVALVFTVEFFLPLSAKSDMNILCRSTLLQMEREGGLTTGLREGLKGELERKGFQNVQVAGTGYVRQGMELTLRVEADFSSSRLTSVFTRSAYSQHMVYDRTAMSRKVIN